MSEAIALACPRCDRRFHPGERLQCAVCGSSAALECTYDIETLRETVDLTARSRCDIWRYRSLLPVSGSDPVTLGEGWTDLISAPTTGDELEVDLSLKLEGANPTGSAKDRGSAVVATHAVEEGNEGVICASTGNAAASIAAYAARGGLDCSLFVPNGVPDAKAIQPRVYGADLITVEGSYSDAYDACRKHGKTTDSLDRSAGANPYVPAGTQTVGFELAEQTDSPEWLVVSMGNGGTIADSWRGWQLFEQLGYTDTTPRLLGVQARKASAIHDRVETDKPTGGTCADSIDVVEPHRRECARQAIEESSGTTITVTDDAIRKAIQTLGSNEGIFAEPASAATVAGIKRARGEGIIDTGEEVVAIITGNGLKDTKTAAKSLD